MAELDGRARCVEENYGDSELATRFGVTRYPAIFVGDVLVATPNDFGFYGKGEAESGGRYAPLKSVEAHERFQSDLRRMLALLLAGDAEGARAVASPAPDPALAEWPAGLALTDLEGRELSPEDRAGRVVLVDFWATWCPPCLKALPWLSELSARERERLAVVAIAVESPAAKVAEVAREHAAPGLRWVQGSPEIVRAFGDISAVPTLLLFDREGRLAASFFGAPPGQHEAVEARLAELMPSSGGLAPDR